MKSTELSMIDYSILTTMEKGGDYACYENIVSALENYALYDNPNGFTKNKDARNYISSLSKEDIRKELLKNIVKKHYYAIYSGYATILKTNKSFVDDLNISEAELLILDSIKTMPIIAIDDILKRMPKLTDLMIKSFVDSRYFDRSYMINNLDNNGVENNECQNLLFKIDSYYEKSNKNEESNRKIIN